MMTLIEPEVSKQPTPDPTFLEPRPVEGPNSLLGRLMKELVRARNASQTALQNLRRVRERNDPESREALLALQKAQREVRISRQNLLKALAVHQGLAPDDFHPAR